MALNIFRVTAIDFWRNSAFVAPSVAVNGGTLDFITCICRRHIQDIGGKPGEKDQEVGKRGCKPQGQELRGLEQRAG